MPGSHKLDFFSSGPSVLGGGGEYIKKENKKIYYAPNNEVRLVLNHIPLIGSVLHLEL